MHARRITALGALTLAFVQISNAQVTINSIFTGAPDYVFHPYSDTANWSPPEVPNNSTQKNYNVTIQSQTVGALIVQMDGDATISNLLLDGAQLNYAADHSLTVTGTTTIVPKSSPGPADLILSSNSSAGSRFVTGSLSTFSQGALSGQYILYPSFDIASGSNCTLQFGGADVRTLRGTVVLSGPTARVVDEFGNDAFRHLSLIESSAQLLMSGHQLTVAGPFTNDGDLEILGGGVSKQQGRFIIQGALTNFDSLNHTLRSGSLGAGGDALIQFDDADIVHNGGSIFLGSALSKIVDQNGNDALRNFVHNTSTGRFGVGFDFVKSGQFTNDGTLTALEATLVLSSLTNFDSSTQTLNNGTYQLSKYNEDAPNGTLVFDGADIVNNSANISLLNGGRILDQNGEDALRHFTHNLANGHFTIRDYQTFVAPSDFSNAGAVTIWTSEPYGPTQFIISSGHTYRQTAGSTSLLGGNFTGDMEINGGSFDTAGQTFGESAVVYGNVSIGNALLTPRKVDIYGNVQLSPGSQFSSRGDADNGFNVHGFFTPDGALQIMSPPSQPSNTDTYVVVTGTIIGDHTFTNAPNGARIATVDGTGSFVVSYTFNAISISQYLSLPTRPQLLNMSTRVHVDTGANVLIGGFIVSGTEPKKVIVRALGPSLSFSIPDSLSDPTLELRDSTGAVIASNDNWRSNQEAEIIASGIPPQNDRESAVVATLPANNSAYTAIVRGANNTTGVGVVELYDLDRSVDSKPINLSTRGYVQTGDNALIGGLLALGQSSLRVMVRAIGPSLQVTGNLRDTTLSFYDSNGNLIAFNDDWRSDQEAEIVATGIAPTSNLESAIVMTLPGIGGTYTAVVQGKDGASGVALVEVYDLNH